MANRFQKVIPGSSYIPHNYEAMFKVGLLKDQEIQGIVDSGQEFLNTEGNYSTIYNPDTEYKLNKVNTLVQGMNELTSQDLSDPVVQNKLRGLRSGFSNDPEVLGAVQRTNAYNTFLTRKKELGEKYRDQNADQFLADMEAYQMGDKEAGERLKLAPDVEPYTDWFKGEFIPTVEKLKADKTITGFGSNYLTTTEGVTPERVQQLLLNGLSSEAYQQMQKDYNYEKRRGQTNKDWSGWVTEKAIAAGNIHSYTQQDAKYTGDANAQARLKIALSLQQGNQSGVPAPVGSFATQQDLKSILYKKFNTSGAKKPIDVYTPYGKQTVEKDDPNYANLINYLAENGGQAIYNLTKSLKLQGLDDAEVTKRVAAALPTGVGIKNQGGKFVLQGDPKAIEAYMMNALSNENSNALGGYTIPNLDPKSTAEQVFALAGTGGVSISVDGSSPSQSKDAMQTLMSELNTTNGIAASISPNTQFDGRPTLEIFVPAKTTADGIIPAKRYSVGLDNYSQAIFSDNTNLFNSKVNMELNVPIPLNNKSQFKAQDGKTYQYDHGINTMEIDQDGKSYISTNIVFYDVNDTDKKTPYYQDYDTWTQEEILPKYLNAPWNNHLKKDFNKSGYEGVQQQMQIMNMLNGE
jgi:hypothetical protein